MFFRANNNELWIEHSVAIYKVNGNVSFSATVACYFTNWTVYRNGLGQFKILNIDTNLCTHIFYAFEGIYPDGTFKIVDEWGDINLSK